MNVKKATFTNVHGLYRQVEKGARMSEIMDELAPRLREVAELVAEGMSNKEIGQELFISEATVRQHVNRLGKILGINGEEHRLRPFITRLVIGSLSGVKDQVSSEKITGQE